MTNDSFQMLPSDRLVRDLMLLPKERRRDEFKYRLMKPIDRFWDCLHVPFKAKIPGGYDVIMASSMLGVFDPTSEPEPINNSINRLCDYNAWGCVEEALRLAYEPFHQNGFNLSYVPIKVLIVPANPENVSVKANRGFSGMGGIPGYMLLIIDPYTTALEQLGSFATHEFSHQVRLTVYPWQNDISLAEYMILEGLADSLVLDMYGAQALGTWITDIDTEELSYSREVLKREACRSGFHEIRGYMFGDLLADEFGYEKVGLSHAAGYAVGFHLVQEYLTSAKIGIIEATMRPYSEILNKIGFPEG